MAAGRAGAVGHAAGHGSHGGGERGAPGGDPIARSLVPGSATEDEPWPQLSALDLGLAFFGV